MSPVSIMASATFLPCEPGSASQLQEHSEAVVTLDASLHAFAAARESIQVNAASQSECTLRRPQLNKLDTMPLPTLAGWLAKRLAIWQASKA